MGEKDEGGRGGALRVCGVAPDAGCRGPNKRPVFQKLPHIVEDSRVRGPNTIGLDYYNKSDWNIYRLIPSE